MTKFNILISLLAVASFSADIGAQENEVDPSGIIAPSNGSGTRALGDLIAGPFDVEAAPYDNRCLGVEEAWGSFWVTGRGHTTLGNNYMIHQYDMNGVYITSYPQNVSGTNFGGWGGRDMEADEAANTLYVGNDNGYVEIMTYDPVTGGISYASTLWSNVTGTVRALCENPSTGNYFTKSFTSDIFEFDMTTGAVINSFSNPAISAYGFGWDSSSNAIWSTSANTSAVEFDPATGLETGRTFFTALGGSQGGADVYNDSRNANGLSIVMLHQTAPDSIGVYDVVGSGTPPPAAWPNLPAAHVAAAGYTEDFESHAGVVPTHMATNELDGLTGIGPDVRAWCNIGQRGACGQETGTGAGLWAGHPGAGSYCLEMGGDPLGPTGVETRNGLVIGLDGSGQGDLTLDFGIVDHGEEADTWDGVWISEDGLAWTNVYPGWQPLAMVWTVISGVDISNAGVSTDGQFYLLFAQDDNFPMGYLDGIQIDDIAVNGVAPPGPTLSVTNLVAGATAKIDLTNCTAGDLAYFVWSAAGGGPVNTPFGPGYVSPPYRVIPLQVDANGHAGMTQNVPPGLTGMALWFHGADKASATLTNPLAMTIG